MNLAIAVNQPGMRQPKFVESHLRSRHARLRRVLLAVAAWAALLCALLLALAGRGPQVALAQDVDAATLQAIPGITITLAVDTPESDGYITTGDTINGDLVTYRIRLVNGTDSALSNVRFEAVLPSQGLSDIFCPGCTDTETSTVERTNAVGDTEIVTITR